MFKACAFIKNDVSAEYNAFQTAFGIGGDVEPEEPDVPDVPEEPEVTLTGISATYSGGDVAVGTLVTDLTGIVVTAHYSDGSTETVTGYTLSGTIAEGSNTVTVSYSGKTTTFTVTGIAESGADTTWEDGVAYSNYNWIDDMYINESTGEMGNFGGGTASDFMPCHGVTALYSSMVFTRAAFYDADKNYITKYKTNNATDTIPELFTAVPENAAYFRVSTAGDQSIKDVIIIPYADLSGIGTEWEDGVAYTDYHWMDGRFINSGIEDSYNGFAASVYMPCHGVKTLTFSDRVQYGAFYDVYMTKLEIINAAAGASVDVSENAVFFRVSGRAETMANIEIVPHG